MVGIITAVVVGVVVGLAGRLIVPGRRRLPTWLAVVIGVLAAFVGTIVAGLLGVASTPDTDWTELVLQIILAAAAVIVAAVAWDRRSVRR